MELLRQELKKKDTFLSEKSRELELKTEEKNCLNDKLAKLDRPLENEAQKVNSEVKKLQQKISNQTEKMEELSDQLNLSNQAKEDQFKVISSLKNNLMELQTNLEEANRHKKIK